MEKKYKLNKKIEKKYIQDLLNDILYILEDEPNTKNWMACIYRDKAACEKDALRRIEKIKGIAIIEPSKATRELSSEFVATIELINKLIIS